MVFTDDILKSIDLNSTHIQPDDYKMRSVLHNTDDLAFLKAKEMEEHYWSSH